MEDIYELLDYLPIDDFGVNNYVTPLFNSALVTIEKEEYQFSYFAIHLIFMTYIYSTVWKIGQFHKVKYEDSLLFARPYNGSKVNFKDLKSIFEFSELPEKDIFEFFSLIGVDNSYIKSIKQLIDIRNEMAHATGKIQISTEDDFNGAYKELRSVVENLQINLNNTIREWYKNELMLFATNELSMEYPTLTDYIIEVFINKYSFSKNDLQACEEYGINRFSRSDQFTLTRNEIDRIKEFHNALKEKYAEIAGVEYEQEEANAN